MVKQMDRKRDMNLDLIRALAVFFTVGMHFMDNSGIYDIEIRGALPFATAMLRMLFSACVPMFLMLSGWLCHKRTLSKRYYLSILPILETYLIASLFCLVYRRIFGAEEIGLRYALGSVINFYACDYAWYVMLYMGLFLMMPFLNLMFHGLAARRQHLALIASFFVLSHLPSVMNVRLQLLSVWWKNLYPITYYLTGIYLSVYRPKLSAGKAACLLLLLTGMSVLFNRFAYGVMGTGMIAVSYDHAEVYVISVLCFLLLLAVPATRFPGFLRRGITWVSRLSFGAYLLSWISDGFLYPLLMRFAPAYLQRLPWAVPMTAASLLFALLLAQLAEWLRKPFDSLIRKLLKL